ncbi:MULTISPECIES: hypothetical protein [unclassified Bradyrhizobium]|uniref:hypothetical protein n=1 Tax=unclassified Bradyrhizobium TaxID=2631580 RepID=UPI001FF9E891|nr:MULTISPECIES: hypothetical protein [unclassified Bradyrhizobium]MCK1714251.1 hypothetical protein [Bradyrhizobium sp. 143]MCK1730963.1 hypothetical protein [Bradyrhizobium sp. 142]
MGDEVRQAIHRTARMLAVYLVLGGSYLGLQSETFAGSRFDGTWNLVFVTQRGACDPTYNFTVNVVNGNVSHPNILTFRGRGYIESIMYATCRRAGAANARKQGDLAAAKTPRIRCWPIASVGAVQRQVRSRR